jgi:hypothetical protein
MGILSPKNVRFELKGLDLNLETFINAMIKNKKYRIFLTLLKFQNVEISKCIHLNIYLSVSCDF